MVPSMLQFDPYCPPPLLPHPSLSLQTCCQCSDCPAPSCHRAFAPAVPSTSQKHLSSDGHLSPSGRPGLNSKAMSSSGGLLRAPVHHPHPPSGVLAVQAWITACIFFAVLPLPSPLTSNLRKALVSLVKAIFPE